MSDKYKEPILNTTTKQSGYRRLVQLRSGVNIAPTFSVSVLKLYKKRMLS